jgi:hypothetical protein
VRTRALLLALAVALPAVAADERENRLSVGIDRTTGDYGQARDTTITYVPVTYRIGGQPWLFGVTVPWIKVQGPANVTRETGAIGGSGGTRTASGIGDVVASATRSLLVTAGGAALDVTGKVKFGTASRSKGLGTGKHDAHFQLDAYGGEGELTPFATAGYKMLGDPPGIDLRNVYFLNAGATRRLDGERSAGLMWHGQQRTTAGGDPQSELTLFYTRRFGVGWRAQFYGLLGLADGSPDYGGGAFAIRNF